MSHVPHELAEEFPDKVDLIHRLKVEDAHCARLFDEYHEVNREIHRAESGVQPTDDFHMMDLRKKRMALKDQIAGALNAADA